MDRKELQNQQKDLDKLQKSIEYEKEREAIGLGDQYVHFAIFWTRFSGFCPIHNCLNLSSGLRWTSTFATLSSTRKRYTTRLPGSKEKKTEICDSSKSWSSSSRLSKTSCNTPKFSRRKQNQWWVNVEIIHPDCTKTTRQITSSLITEKCDCNTTNYIYIFISANPRKWETALKQPIRKTDIQSLCMLILSYRIRYWFGGLWCLEYVFFSLTKQTLSLTIFYEASLVGELAQLCNSPPSARETVIRSSAVARFVCGRLNWVPPPLRG